MAEATDLYIGRVLFLLAFLVCLVIFIIECRNTNRRTSAKNHNENPKYLKLWSLLTLLFCTITPALFAAHLSPLCKYTFSMARIAWINSKCLLTFYQIARLQFIFSSLHGDYPFCCYMFLYIVGVAVILSISLSGIFIYNLKIIDSQCVAETTSAFRVHGLITTAAFYVWDWTVLSMYIVKNIHIKNIIKNSSHQELKIKANFILKKILFLTLLYELELIIVIIVDNRLRGHVDHVSLAVQHAIRALDSILTSLVMYLMIDGNNNQYIALLNITHRTPLCFCCKYLVIEHLKQNEDMKQVTEKQPQCNTIAPINITASAVIELKSGKNHTPVTITPPVSAPISKQTEVTEPQSVSEPEDDSTSQRTTTSELERYREINRKTLNKLKKQTSPNDL